MTGCGSRISENTQNSERDTITQNSEVDTETQSEIQGTETETNTESQVVDTEMETESETGTKLESEEQTETPEGKPNEGKPNDSKPEDSQQPGTDSSEKEEPDTPVVEERYDVPKVYIYTGQDGINTETYTSCKIVIVEEKGEASTTISDESSKIKIRGNSTSAGYKKPFNIKFSEKSVFILYKF